MADEGDDVEWWASDLSLLFYAPGLADRWLETVAMVLDERPSLDGLEKRGLLATVSASVAAREAWWRLEPAHRIDIRCVDAAILARAGIEPAIRSIEDESKKSSGGPVGRYFTDPSLARLRSASTWRLLDDAIHRDDHDGKDDGAVVVVSGADLRVADGPVRDIDALPPTRLSNADHAAVVAALARDKLRWARRHRYGFEFVVTNSVARAIRAAGLRHWEWAKVFALVAVAHSARTRRRHASNNDDDIWLLWLDHDIWINPKHRGRSARSYVDAVPTAASLALANFRSFNTGVVLLKLDTRGRTILLHWLLAVIANVVDCQPFDQAALHHVLLTRLANQSLFPNHHFVDDVGGGGGVPPPLGFTCKRPACGGTSAKPFPMCNPRFHAALDAHLADVLPPAGCHSKRRVAQPPPGPDVPWCGDAVDRALANPVINPAGFHVLPGGPGRPRLQCFEARQFDVCQRAGANFPPTPDEHPSWLFAHKSIHLFLANASRLPGRRRRRR